MFVESCYPEKYDESSDTFSSLGSSQIPLIQKFLTFWDETVIEDGQPYAELEMEEIATLFSSMAATRNDQKKQKYLLKSRNHGHFGVFSSRIGNGGTKIRVSRTQFIMGQRHGH